MIFESSYTGTGDLSSVKESPYELGVAGAMMHVYENECNYNAIMKSVGLSELKYYQETGRDLFVHEAGAFGSFIDKLKAFFKKVIEKIKSIFKKFLAVFNQFTMEGKKFAKKYGKELMRKDLTDFEFVGYKFIDLSRISSGLDTASKLLLHESGATASEINDDYDIEKLIIYYKEKTDDSDTIHVNKYNDDLKTKKYDDDDTKDYYKDADAVKDAEEVARAKVAKAIAGDNKIKSTKMDESEFRDELHDAIYGDSKKETLDNISIREQLQFIETCDKDIREANRSHKAIEREIDKLLKQLDDTRKEIDKKYSYSNINSGKFDNSDSSKVNRDKLTKNINQIIKNINNGYSIRKSISNDITIGFGMLVQAYKDRNKQARAICIKALSYKHESAMVSESYYDNDDVFAGVIIR